MKNRLPYPNQQKHGSEIGNFRGPREQSTINKDLSSLRKSFAKFFSFKNFREFILELANCEKVLVFLEAKVSPSNFSSQLRWRAQFLTEKISSGHKDTVAKSLRNFFVLILQNP